MESPLRIFVVACQPRPGDRGRWRVTFRLSNVSESSLELCDAWVPHGRFRGDGHIPLQATLPAMDESCLAVEVTSQEEAGAVVENAFLILRTSTCRVFARLRVDFDAAARARPIVEAVTAQSLE
ncbi:MAG: hypothetical protein JO057_15330 [Chloroflexi bacterium]|nr:hypothetical protein [Chloroflexota bacterium]